MRIRMVVTGYIIGSKIKKISPDILNGPDLEYKIIYFGLIG